MYQSRNIVPVFQLIVLKNDICFLVFRKIFKILKVFKKPIDSQESEDDCRSRKMEKLSAEIRDYPHDLHDYRAFNLNDCPCKICELKSSLSLLFT